MCFGMSMFRAEDIRAFAWHLYNSYFLGTLPTLICICLYRLLNIKQNNWLKYWLNKSMCKNKAIELISLSHTFILAFFVISYLWCRWSITYLNFFPFLLFLYRLNSRCCNSSWLFFGLLLSFLLRFLVLYLNYYYFIVHFRIRLLVNLHLNNDLFCSCCSNDRRLWCFLTSGSSNFIVIGRGNNFLCLSSYCNWHDFLSHFWVLRFFLLNSSFLLWDFDSVLFNGLCGALLLLQHLAACLLDYGQNLVSSLLILLRGSNCLCLFFFGLLETALAAEVASGSRTVKVNADYAWLQFVLVLWCFHYWLFLLSYLLFVCIHSLYDACW